MDILHLSSEDIMTATEKVSAFLSDKGIDRKETLRYQFAVEEVLLTYRNKFGEDTSFKMYLEKRMGTCRIILRISGDSFDPFMETYDDEQLMRNLMENMGKTPVWNYHRSCNEVIFIAEKKKTVSSLFVILSAIVLGIGLGFLARLLPEKTVYSISEFWLAPIQDAVLGFLSCLSALFVLLSVTSGICSMGDVSTFNRVGRKLIFRLLFGVAIVTALTAAFLPFFFPLLGEETSKIDFSTLWQMIIEIVPTNIIETFSTGNTMQIVFIAVVVSMTLLVTAPKSRQIVDTISQLSELVLRIIQKVIVFMPIIVFISLFRLASCGDITILISAYKYPLVLILFSTTYMIIQVIITSLNNHISPILLVKKILPTFLIAFSTASSAAALPENLNTCENRLGIDKTIINVGIPLGQTIYMPSVAMIMMIGILCGAQIFNVPVSLSSYLFLAVASGIISVATPPVPGSLMAAFVLLMTQMKMPSDAMTFIIALDVIIDRISTCTDVTALQMKLVDVSKSLKLIDNQKLRSHE